MKKKSVKIKLSHVEAKMFLLDVRSLNFEIGDLEEEGYSIIDELYDLINPLSWK